MSVELVEKKNIEKIHEIEVNGYITHIMIEQRNTKGIISSIWWCGFWAEYMK